MRFFTVPAAVLFAMFLCVSGPCLSASASRLEISTVCSGERVSIGSVALESSFSPISGSSLGGSLQLRSGYVGQIQDPASLAIEGPGAAPIQLAEESSLQLSVLLTHTDGTFFNAVDDVVWDSPLVWLTGIDNGLAEAAIVSSERSESVSASYLGFSDDSIVTILNTDNDNYVTSGYDFAGDGIDDEWQVNNFSLGDPNAAPFVVNTAGFENYFLYAFGQDLTDFHGQAFARPEVVIDASGLFLTIIYTRPETPTASIDYEVIFSDDVAGTINTSAGASYHYELNGDGTVTITIRDTVLGAPTRFAQVVASYDAP